MADILKLLGYCNWKIRHHSPIVRHRNNCKCDGNFPSFTIKHPHIYGSGQDRISKASINILHDTENTVHIIFG